MTDLRGGASDHDPLRRCPNGRQGCDDVEIATGELNSPLFVDQHPIFYPRDGFAFRADDGRDLIEVQCERCVARPVLLVSPVIGPVISPVISPVIGPVIRPVIGREISPVISAVVGGIGSVLHGHNYRVWV